MARYIESDKLIDWCNQTFKAQTTVVGKEYVNAFLQAVVMSDTADVVPRSEVEELKKEYEDKIAELKKEIEDLESTQEITPEAKYLVDTKADKLISLLTEINKTQDQAKQEVAREIFEEIEKRFTMYSHIHKYAEEAKHSTEEYADGTPCEMTSVWEVLSLHKNGWDDYETMCKLQDNIGNIEKSRLLKEVESDLAELKKKYIGE